MKFTTKWLGLEVLTPDGSIQFKNGEYETTDKKEIDILKNVADVEMIDDKSKKE